MDRLLASPQYGEQWARHWLDVVRYADTSGFSNDHARPTAWRYRDYLIRAFNNDKPYDKFILEQIAGDEIDPDDPRIRECLGLTLEAIADTAGAQREYEHAIRGMQGKPTAAATPVESSSSSAVPASRPLVRACPMFA